MPNYTIIDIIEIILFTDMFSTNKRHINGAIITKCLILPDRQQNPTDLSLKATKLGTKKVDAKMAGELQSQKRQKLSRKSNKTAVKGKFCVMLEQAACKSIVFREWMPQRSRTEAQWLHRARCPVKKSDSALGAAFGAVRSSPTGLQIDGILQLRLQPSSKRASVLFDACRRSTFVFTRAIFTGAMNHVRSDPYRRH
jgi:hypothetical protein